MEGSCLTWMLLLSLLLLQLPQRTISLSPGGGFAARAEIQFSRGREASVLLSGLVSSPGLRDLLLQDPPHPLGGGGGRGGSGVGLGPASAVVLVLPVCGGRVVLQLDVDDGDGARGGGDGGFVFVLVKNMTGLPAGRNKKS